MFRAARAGISSFLRTSSLFTRQSVRIVRPQTRAVTVPTPKRSSWYNFGGSQNSHYQSDAWYRNPKTVTWAIIGTNTAVFGLWQLSRGDREFMATMRHNFVCSRDNLQHGRVWTLLTATFSQADLMHLLGNMFCVYSFGPALAQVLGTRRFLGVYLVAGTVGCASHIVYTRMQGKRDVGVLGASGSTMGMLTTFACMFPHTKIYLYGIVGVPAWALAAGLLAMDLWSGATNRASSISHSGHIGGALTGLAYYFAVRRGFRF